MPLSRDRMVEASQRCQPIYFDHDDRRKAETALLFEFIRRVVAVDRLDSQRLVFFLLLVFLAVVACYRSRYLRVAEQVIAAISCLASRV